MGMGTYSTQVTTEYSTRTADSNRYYLPFFVAIGANRFEKKRLALFLFHRQRSKTMIFSDSPSQKALERMMTQVKGFPPRGSGVMVLRRFEYTAEMCDCRLCLYYNRKKKCTVSQ